MHHVSFNWDFVVPSSGVHWDKSVCICRICRPIYCSQLRCAGFQVSYSILLPGWAPLGVFLSFLFVQQNPAKGTRTATPLLLYCHYSGHCHSGRTAPHCTTLDTRTHMGLSSVAPWFWIWREDFKIAWRDNPKRFKLWALPLVEPNLDPIHVPLGHWSIKG